MLIPGRGFYLGLLADFDWSDAAAAAHAVRLARTRAPLLHDETMSVLQTSTYISYHYDHTKAFAFDAILQNLIQDSPSHDQSGLERRPPSTSTRSLSVPYNNPVFFTYGVPVPASSSPHNRRIREVFGFDRQFSHSWVLSSNLRDRGSWVPSYSNGTFCPLQQNCS